MVTTAVKLKLAPWKKSYDQPRQYIKRQRHYFADKGLSSQSYDFSSIHVWMWELDYKESWEWRPFQWGSKRDTDIKNRLLDSVGEGEGGMIWDNNIETCILPYVK